jgi:hypothetical protein
MQALKNEELRLQLQIARMNQDNFLKEPYHSPTPIPKEASWEEHARTTYETGYQQQRS